MTTANTTRIHELMHQLQTLEVDLIEANKNSLMPETDFKVRFDRLHRAAKHAARLRGVISTKAVPSATPSHVDLPVMADYSRMEQKIVSKYISDTKNFTGDLAKKMQKISDWARDAANDASGWFVTMWRLSWIRRQMRKIESDIANVLKARGVVEDFITRTSNEPWDEKTKNGQKILENVFQEFEAATARVTVLKARLRSEAATNVNMKRWLNQYSVNRRQTDPEKIPPTPNIVSEVIRPVSDRLTSGAKVANERLVIARQLANVICPESSQEAEIISENTAPKAVEKVQVQVAKKGKNAQKGARK